MKNFIKNIILLVVVLVLSYFTSEYFGKLYDYFSPLYDSSFFPIPKEGLITITGVPFAYVFFLILLFKLFAWGNKKKWIGWLLVPPLLFFGSGDIKHIYLPIILGLIAFYLGKLLQRLFIKNYTT
ncbi:MAG TPA: hypothetical protein VJH67_00975 [Candidatus Paceibacterota bacterium]